MRDHTTVVFRVFAVAVVGLAAAAAAAVSLSAGGYSQNFDGMSTGTLAPDGWTSGAVGGSGSTYTTEGAVTGSVIGGAVTLNNSLTVADQTYGAGSNAQGFNASNSGVPLNRFLGTRPTTVANAIVEFNITNGTGAALSSLLFQYDMVDWVPKASGTEELFGFRFAYLDGSTWTRVPGLDMTVAGTSTPTTISFTSPVAIGGTLTFRFFDDNANNSALDTGHAIDNVSINLPVIPEPAAFSLLVMGMLPLLRRRWV